MNRQLIVYMPIMILCMLKIKQLKKMLKEQVLFFVLQLPEIVLVIHRQLNSLNIKTLERYLPESQFSVSGSGFFKNEKVMNTPSFKEDHISKIPALQMLVNLGCTFTINLNLHNKPNRFIVQKQLYRYAI